MRLSKVVLLAAFVGGFFTPVAQADVKPHPIFSDNMVLQQGVPVVVWGIADPGEEIAVELERKGPNDGEAIGVGFQADKDGNWSAKFPAQKAGTGYTLRVKGKNTIEFKNVAVGEVWVCSGQSNMQWSINASETPEKIKAAADHPNLRLFTVNRRPRSEADRRSE